MVSAFVIVIFVSFRFSNSSAERFTSCSETKERQMEEKYGARGLFGRWMKGVLVSGVAMRVSRHMDGGRSFILSENRQRVDYVSFL